METRNRILPLSHVVQFEIKSSAAILSLNDVVLGLVENAIDASADKIDIQLDYAKGCCVVVDDGEGIPVTEFREAGHLAELHCMCFQSFFA